MNDTLTAELPIRMIPEWVLDAGISDKAIRLYCVLARYADNETHRAFPSTRKPWLSAWVVTLSR
jgi:hypothetical protein